MRRSGEEIIEELYRIQPPPGTRIPYGTQPSQFGDLRLPAGPGPCPVVVSIHGGNWRARYSSAYMGHLCGRLAEAGIATWNIEYRRVGEDRGGWPGTFLDVGAATDHLKTLAREYDLDLDRVVALGHSAGGHLALWLAARPRISQDSPLYTTSPLPLRGCVGISPVSDLTRYWQLGISNRAAGQLLGGSPAEVPERYAAASPIELLPLGAPQILVHGVEDREVPFELSERYVARASRLEDPATLTPLPDAGHFEPVDPRTEEWVVVMNVVQGMLGTRDTFRSTPSVSL